MSIFSFTCFTFFQFASETLSRSVAKATLIVGTMRYYPIFHWHLCVKFECKDTDIFPYSNKNNATLNKFVYDTHKSMMKNTLIKALTEVK